MLIFGTIGSELDFLTADFTLPNEEQHPYPRDVAYNYTGRLVAKFLLSFTDGHVDLLFCSRTDSFVYSTRYH